MSNPDLKQAVASGAKRVEFNVGAVRFQLLRVEPGEFTMGSAIEEEGHDANEGPPRRIHITKPYYLGQCEITQAQYKAVMGSSPSNYRGDDLAEDQITYPDAMAFCQKVSSIIGMALTLPTEAQWEYACRAGTQTRFYSGNSIQDLDRIAWYADNSSRKPQPVGGKLPNSWGFYDMSGNVWELCADYIQSYSAMADSDPLGTVTGKYGAMRGGGYLHGADYCRSATRLVSNVRFAGAGIRIAINP